MWTTILYWSLLSFGIVHFVSGLVALLSLRRTLPLRVALALPFVSTLLGGLIPCTAGVITGRLMCIDRAHVLMCPQPSSSPACTQRPGTP